MSPIAFGQPGILPTFAAGDKDVVMTALGSARVWATVGGGVLNEVFWPTTGRPQLRDLGFLVTGGGFWVEVKRAANYTITTPDPAVPLPRIVHHDERFTLTLEIVCDPDRDAVAIRYELLGPAGDVDESLALHLLASPHLGGTGHGNDAWVADGVLHAGRGDEHLAILADAPFALASAGYVGHSDGWQDIARHGQPIWRFTNAPQGNVALTATLSAARGEIALAFAGSAIGARTLATGTLVADFDRLALAFRLGWEQWARGLPTFDTSERLSALARTSAMVLRVHEDVTFPGAIVASLATPWGAAHDDPGGYHLVWPRDCAETGLALAAIGCGADAHRTIEFLASTQLADGHWPQNFTPGGEPFWTGLQLDEVALPVILACKLAERSILPLSSQPVTAMVRAATRYLAANGPYTNQDRWEETPGASPFTLAATVAALVGAAQSGWLDSTDARYALSLADWWNDRIESLAYVEGSPLDEQYGTAGHYERIGSGTQNGTRGWLVLANRGGETYPIDRLLGLEFLALVRYGLRSPQDPRIVDTVRLIDGELRKDTPGGPLYYRYQHDGYGEHADGSPFDGVGIGRLWPLLAGERGHYALDAGEDPLPYLTAMAASCSAGDLLPEQVWDVAPIPQRRLSPGKPTGSATPLVWAHAEFLKLLIATTTGMRADRLDVVSARYAKPGPPTMAHVRDEVDLATIAAGILIESADPFVLHYGIDGWQDVADVDSEPVGLGRHGVVLTRTAHPGAKSINWTRFDPALAQWEGVDHRVEFLLPTA